MIRRRRAVAVAALICLLPVIGSAQTRTQAAVDEWLATRAAPEHVTGVAAYVSFGDTKPAIEAFAGKAGAAPDAPPVDRTTLFAMGSTSKSFTDAIVLKLEAEGKISLDNTLGKFLPQYPAWQNVTLRQLLNMTSGIANYSETETMSEIWVNQATRSLTMTELVGLVYPRTSAAGYHYSNTNYILAAMIAEKITGQTYRDLVQDWVIQAQALQSTFFEPSFYPPAIAQRIAHGYFANPACADDQPDCKQSWNLPLLGRDIHDMSTSWAQAAGGAIANAHDVDQWMRAVFTGRVVPPRQQAEWTALVSTRTGQPVADVSPNDPQGFALGLARGILGPLGTQWFYQGETLGFRTLYVWFADRNLMITVQTNSQPAAEENKLSDLVGAIYAVVTGPDK